MDWRHFAQFEPEKYFSLIDVLYSTMTEPFNRWTRLSLHFLSLSDTDWIGFELSRHPDWGLGPRLPQRPGLGEIQEVVWELSNWPDPTKKKLMRINVGVYHHYLRLNTSLSSAWSSSASNCCFRVT